MNKYATFIKQLKTNLVKNGVSFTSEKHDYPNRAYNNIENSAYVEFLLASNRPLGHQNIIVFLDATENLNAISILNATPAMIQMLNSLGTFYGISFSKYTHNASNLAEIILFFEKMNLNNDLNEKEKLALLQLIYQLIISAEGDINEYRDNASIDYALYSLGYSPKYPSTRLLGNELWRKAIQEMNPYEAFDIIRNLNPAIKRLVKKLLEYIANINGNKYARLDILRQILVRINA